VDKTVPDKPSPAAPGPGAGVCRAISVNLNFLTAVAGSSEDPALDEHIAQLTRLVDTAPAEIKGDLQVVLQFDQRSLSAIQAGQSPDSIQETPELTAALTHVARWISAHCTH
jgi:hypothetical protein